jgi:hypothetical protein
MRGAINYEKPMKKSKLAAAYEGLAPQDRRVALAEYRTLCSELDLSDKMLASHLLLAILPAAALYRVLSRRVGGKDAALSVIRDAVLYSARPMARMFQALGRLPFGFPLLRVITPVAMKSGFGEAGWRIEWDKSTRDKIAFTARSCFYDRVLRQYGMPELTPIFCEYDDVVYGAIPHIRWGRTKTIGRGDAICDFCFTNGRRSQ